MQWKHWKYDAFALACLGFILIGIEVHQPYYFLQDDNRNFGLPLLVHSYRSVIHGEVPLFNFHQFGGSPVLSDGASAALYPPGYLALAASRLFWGHNYAAIDLLVIFHLLVGACGLVALARLLTANRRAAAWAGLTGVLGSFVIYVSACWAPFSGLAAYFPWMLYLSLRVLRDHRAGAVAGLVAVRLLLFYIGYPQVFAYAALFEILIVLGAARFPGTAPRCRPGAAWRAYILSWLAVAVFAAPLALPLWHQTTLSAERGQHLDWIGFTVGAFTPQSWLGGLLNPFSSANFNRWPITFWLPRSIPYLSFIGYITLPLIGCGFWALFRNRLSRVQRHYFFLLFCTTAISLGWSTDLLAPILYRVPLLNRFRWPFKLQVFTALLLVSMASLGFAWLLRSVKGRRLRNAVFVAAIALTTVNFLVLYTAFPARIFRTMQEPVPLREPLIGSLQRGRILSVGYRFEDQDDANSLGMAYATLWGLDQVAGYDPLLPQANRHVAPGTDTYLGSFGGAPENLPLSIFRQWGVKWYVVASYAPQYGPMFLRNGLTLFHQDRNRTVYQDPQARPLVDWEQPAGAPPAPAFTANTLRLSLDPPRPGRLRLGFVSNPFFQARIDGRAAPLQRTEDGQMALDVPAGPHQVLVEYRDPYFSAGCWICAAGLLASVLAFALRAFQPRRLSPAARTDLSWAAML